MPRPLRTIRAWEAGGRVYGALGVPAYGRLLRRTALRLNRDVYLHNGLRDTRRVGAELEAAEASHFWAAALVVPYMAYAAFMGMWSALLGVTLAQVFINIYPVLHLRLSRYRLIGLSEGGRLGVRAVPGRESAGCRTELIAPRAADSRSADAL